MSILNDICVLSGEMVFSILVVEYIRHNVEMFFFTRKQKPLNHTQNV